jgi:DNA-binding MarR family transcriptional regulator
VSAAHNMAASKKPAGRPVRPEGDSRAVDMEAVRGAVSGGPEQGSADLAVLVTGMLFRLAPRLVDVQDMGAREHGLGFARGRVLWALHDSGPVLMRKLSQVLRVTPRTVTGLVDALEADGWVTRSPHPADRRATIISLTPAAETTLARLRTAYEGFAHDLLDDVSADDLASSRRVIAVIENGLDEAVARGLAAFETRPAPAGRAGLSGPSS